MKTEVCESKFETCESAEECEIAHQPAASRVRLLQALKNLSEWGDTASMESARIYARIIYERER